MKEKCYHIIGFITLKRRYDSELLTEEDLYEEIIGNVMCEYNNYKYGDFDEYSHSYCQITNFNFSKRNFFEEYSKDKDYFSCYEFSYCPNCGKKFYFQSCVNRINKKIYEEISVLPKRTENDLIDIKNKIKQIRGKDKEIKQNKAIKNVGYVYLVKLDKHYKIGISKKPNQRLKEFTKLPYELETILCEKVNDYENAEIQFHEHFEYKRVRGEWFELDEQDIEYIKNYLKGA